MHKLLLSHCLHSGLYTSSSKIPATNSFPIAVVSFSRDPPTGPRHEQLGGRWKFKPIVLRGNSTTHLYNFLFRLMLPNGYTRSLLLLFFVGFC